MRECETLTLRRNDAAATVTTRGAELARLAIGGRELIWPGDAASWPRSAPVLFPFCGWLAGGAFRHRGRIYPSGVHGFGPDAGFSVRKADGDHLSLSLRDSAETLERYPFSFQLSVDATLQDDGLRTDFLVHNPAREALPYALGFHPGFRWPFAGGDKADYRLEFSDDEEPRASLIAPGGLFTDQTVPIPLQGRVLDIAAATKERDSIVMLDARSRRVDFVAPDNSRISIEVENFPHWVFWSLPGADFLCIEAWTGQGDPVGFTGEITAKPGMRLLAPGAHAQHGFSIRYIPG